MDHGYRPSSITSDTLHLLTINPFAEEDISHAAPAVLPNNENEGSQQENTGFRRRSLETRTEINRGSFAKHTRSRTELDPRISGSNVHPLRSAGLAPGPNDAGVTRPHLSRMLNVGTLVDAPPVEADITGPAAEERDVLIHEIIPGDSLAGVSLKYGISMADLRGANHLWASDPIHLRTELYIPVDKASRLKPVPTDNLISISPAEEVSDPMDTVTQDSQPPRRPSDAETIRRVPASQLSFFPPPAASRSFLQPRPPQEHLPTPSSNSHNPRYTSPPPHSLTSLLTSLPIAASTRDTIIARLSFDSVSSSYSDREEENNSHELDDVRHAKFSNIQSIDAETEDYSLITPKASHWKPRVGVPAGTSQTNLPTPHSHTHVRHLSSSPQSYIPSHPQIRTVQLEPSPAMQLPPLKGTLSSSKGKTKARINLVDVDFELEGTGSTA